MLLCVSVAFMSCCSSLGPRCRVELISEASPWRIPSGPQLAAAQLPLNPPSCLTNLPWPILGSPLGLHSGEQLLGARWQGLGTLGLLRPGAQCERGSEMQSWPISRSQPLVPQQPPREWSIDARRCDHALCRIHRESSLPPSRRSRELGTRSIHPDSASPAAKSPQPTVHCPLT
jgi:hypothetical protein